MIRVTVSKCVKHNFLGGFMAQDCIKWTGERKEVHKMLCCIFCGAVARGGTSEGLCFQVCGHEESREKMYNRLQWALGFAKTSTNTSLQQQFWGWENEHKTGGRARLLPKTVQITEIREMSTRLKESWIFSKYVQRIHSEMRGMMWRDLDDTSIAKLQCWSFAKVKAWDEWEKNGKEVSWRKEHLRVRAERRGSSKKLSREELGNVAQRRNQRRVVREKLFREKEAHSLVIRCMFLLWLQLFNALRLLEITFRGSELVSH